MKAVILAAGRGSRLGALTSGMPKCLVPIAGGSLLEHALRAMRAAGISDIAIVRGYRRELIDVPATYFDNERWQDTQMVRSLECAREWLRHDPCVVSYSDIMYPMETIQKLMDADGDIIVPYNTDWLSLWRARFEDPLSDAETFRLNLDGTLREIGGRPRSVEEIEGQYMGLLRFTPHGWRQTEAFLRRMPDGAVDRMTMTELLQKLIDDGVSIRAIPIAGGWFEIDSEKDLELFQFFGGCVLGDDT